MTRRLINTILLLKNHLTRLSRKSIRRLKFTYEVIYVVQHLQLAWTQFSISILVGKLGRICFYLSLLLCRLSEFDQGNELEIFLSFQHLLQSWNSMQNKSRKKYWSSHNNWYLELQRRKTTYGWRHISQQSKTFHHQSA